VKSILQARALKEFSNCIKRIGLSKRKTVRDVLDKWILKIKFREVHDLLVYFLDDDSRSQKVEDEEDITLWGYQLWS